jgi:hypothetical protein
MHKHILKALYIILPLVLLVPTACTVPAGTGQVLPLGQAAQQAHVRQLQTTPYKGDRGAIIFTLTVPADGSLQETVDRIITIFGENKATLDVAVTPPKGGNYSAMIYLRHYIDAGIIDVSINGNSINWLGTEAAGIGTSPANLKSNLLQIKKDVKSFFGDEPLSCIVPFEHVDQGNYSLLQDAGFRILSTEYSSDFNLSNEPVTWTGAVERDGLYRLPLMGAIDYSARIDQGIPASQQTESDKSLLEDVQMGLDKLGVAAVEVQASLFTGQDNKPDATRLAKLANLIKSCQQLGHVTTSESWGTYMDRWAAGNPGRQRVMPVYNGGPAIIFRMDDVSVGWHEDVVEAIIKLFQSNGVPVDVGVVSNVDGTNSYEMPWLQKYIDGGNIGISVHGYDWTYYQFDTTQTYKSAPTIITDTCILPGTAIQPEIPKERLTYAYIRFKLMTARDRYLQYFGVKPVALTVPTDFYDETGYKAIRDSGFKVFGTQINVEPHPSTQPVDFNGRQDPGGMYRIPTAEDVCVWDNCTWGDVFDISQIMSITDYCKYHNAWDEVFYNDFGVTVCGTLGDLGVAAIGIHPDAFIDIDGKPNQAKLQKLDIIIKYCKTIATITTFEQWYNYTSSAK